MGAQKSLAAHWDSKRSIYTTALILIPRVTGIGDITRLFMSLRFTVLICIFLKYSNLQTGYTFINFFFFSVKFFSKISACLEHPIGRQGRGLWPTLAQTFLGIRDGGRACPWEPELVTAAGCSKAKKKAEGPK